MRGKSGIRDLSERDVIASVQARATPEALADRMSAFADEIMDPLLCRQPAYGAPGYAHCAACCYGTGYVVTCDEEQAMVDAATALNRAAALLRASSQPVASGATATGLTRPLRPESFNV